MTALAHLPVWAQSLAYMRILEARLLLLLILQPRGVVENLGNGVLVFSSIRVFRDIIGEHAGGPKELEVLLYNLEKLCMVRVVGVTVNSRGTKTFRVTLTANRLVASEVLQHATQENASN